MKRRYDLDWLRVFAFALLMLFHAGMLFSSWNWHVKNLETSASFDRVMRFVHGWRMPLLFFISGSAVWFALEKYSTARFFLERQKRLLLPLVFGMLVIIPPQVYFERLYQQQHYSSFLDFYRTVFTSGAYPEGNLSWHHLWYIPYIWAYSMLLLPLFMWLRSGRGRRLLHGFGVWLQRPGALFLIFLPSAMVEVALRPFWPNDANNLIADWGNFTHKLMFFITGFMLASTEEIYDVLARQRKFFLIAGVVTLAVLDSIWNAHVGLPTWLTVPYRLLMNFHAWMWILAALGYARCYLSFNHPALRYANEAVYPFYVLHQTVIIILGYFLVRMSWGIPVKFTITVAATFLFCALLYALLIRPWKLVRVMFGMGWMRRKDACKQEGSAGHPASVTVLPGLAKASGLLAIVTALVVLGFSGCSAKRGTLEWHTVPARSLAGNQMEVCQQQPLAVYLPPSYYRDSGRRFPVLYLLPNFNRLIWNYTGGTFQGFRLKDSLDRQIKSGATREMIVVIPNSMHSLGGSWYHNNGLTGNWGDFIGGDLVKYVDAHFRTEARRDARAIAGHGMGGTGALELALERPEVFGSVYAMSPAILEQDGLRVSGLLAKKRIIAWNSALDSWAGLAEPERKRRFREHVQAKLNTSSADEHMQGVLLSCAAAFAYNPALPFPHFALSGGARDQPDEETSRALERGLGDWEVKLSHYAVLRFPLQSIVIECGTNGEYEWIRRGAEHVCARMNTRGIVCRLQLSEGGHDSTLGQRLETAMLPAVAHSFRQLE